MHPAHVCASSSHSSVRALAPSISFQEPDGCTELWEQICGLQGRPTDEGPLPAAGEGGAADGGDGGGGGGCGPKPAGGEQIAEANGAITLPAVEHRNVAAIAEMLAEVPYQRMRVCMCTYVPLMLVYAHAQVPIMRRQRMAEAMLQCEYIPQLAALFEELEDLESVDDLQRMFTIFKGIVMLNSQQVYEVLLRDDLLTRVVGALEYDPELRCHQVSHRRFLSETANFRQVAPISDDAVVRRNYMKHAACACVHVPRVRVYPLTCMCTGASTGAAHPHELPPGLPEGRGATACTRRQLVRGAQPDAVLQQRADHIQSHQRPALSGPATRRALDLSAHPVSSHARGHPLTSICMRMRRPR